MRLSFLVLALPVALPAALLAGDSLGLQGYLLGILGIGLLIFLHEMGHFLVAKWMGMPVETFSIGFGKRLWGFRWRETDVRLSVLPLGGYVKLAGFNPEEPGAEDPHGFLKQPYWKRMLFYCGGILANLAVALACFTLAGADQARVTKVEQKVIVAMVTPGSAAERGGLKAEDELLSVGGLPLPASDLDKQIIPLIKAHPGQPVAFELLREGRPMQLQLTPDNVDGKGLLGFNPLAEEVPLEKRAFRAGDFVQGVKGSVFVTLRMSGLIFDFLKRLASFKAHSNEVGGPVAITKQMAQAAHQGLWDFLLICGAISVQLAVLNALPIPMLDGGHMAVLSLERIRRRDFSLEFKEKLFTGGFLLLAGLMAVVIFLDVWRLGK